MLDINQFTAILIKAILYHNNHHYMDWYELDKDMIASDVRPVPEHAGLPQPFRRANRPLRRAPSTPQTPTTRALRRARSRPE